MSRYKSSQKWRKREAGWYVAESGAYEVLRVPSWSRNNVWRLWQVSASGYAESVIEATTLAACQEHADRLEGLS